MSAHWNDVKQKLGIVDDPNIGHADLSDEAVRDALMDYCEDCGNARDLYDVLDDADKPGVDVRKRLLVIRAELSRVLDRKCRQAEHELCHNGTSRLVGER